MEDIGSGAEAVRGGASAGRTCFSNETLVLV